MRVLDTVLPALCASSSSESESQQQSAIQVDMEVQLQKTIAIYNAASTESNRGLQHTSMEIEICSYPYQPHSQGFPKKRFGQAKPSFKVSWFDNHNWSKWLHWEATRERAYCIICRNIYALGQLTMHRNRELKQHLLQRNGKM